MVVNQHIALPFPTHTYPMVPVSTITKAVPFVEYKREFKTIDVSVYASADEILKHLAEQESEGWWLVNSIRQEHTSVAQGGEFIRLIFARTVKAE